jgi:hypothetical protein
MIDPDFRRRSMSDTRPMSNGFVPPDQYYAKVAGAERDTPHHAAGTDQPHDAVARDHHPFLSAAAVGESANFAGQSFPGYPLPETGPWRIESNEIATPQNPLRRRRRNGATASAWRCRLGYWGVTGAA